MEYFERFANDDGKITVRDKENRGFKITNVSDIICGRFNEKEKEILDFLAEVNIPSGITDVDNYTTKDICELVFSGLREGLGKFMKENFYQFTNALHIFLIDVLGEYVPTTDTPTTMIAMGSKDDGKVISFAMPISKSRILFAYASHTRDPQTLTLMSGAPYSRYTDILIKRIVDNATEKIYECPEKNEITFRKLTDDSVQTWLKKEIAGSASDI